ncbi:MAG TPA: cob(I)yrinic acid a,c-diamide adenosyltransferase [Catalimonadaceae bacterium]|nr:cob(I)yrinic acid a,c-diamide adenosyltransferase [Catalimonadaceae bacterium]
MKIYTKTGDTGKTSLVEGTRISKGHLRIESYGNVDELNATLGLLADQDVNKSRYAFLKTIQDLLFIIGSNLASDPARSSTKVPPVLDSDIHLLEKAMDEMDSELPELRHFVLPGGHPSVSIAHLARTVCRRAERSVVRLTEVDEVNPLIPIYLNRLSDYFFVLSRHMAHSLGIEEVKWEPRKSV